MVNITVESYGETFIIEPKFGKYTNDRLAVEFWFDGDYGPEPFAKATVNMPEVHLNDGEVLIKDWAENAPLIEALLEAGWLEPTGREVLSGFVVPAVMKLAGPLAEAYAEQVSHD